MVCGKTGTVENYYKGIKQKDHAVFAAFAPRENPKIAIAVICENAGFGASSSAPIASLMIERYLKDSITEPDRVARIEAISKLNLMPARILAEIRQRDSIVKAKNAKALLEKTYIKAIKDTTGIEEEDNSDALDELNKTNDSTTKKESKGIPITTDTTPAKKEKIKSQPVNAVLPDRKKAKIKNDSLH